MCGTKLLSANQATLGKIPTDVVETVRHIAPPTTGRDTWMEIRDTWMEVRDEWVEVVERGTDPSTQLTQLSIHSSIAGN